MDYVQRIQLAVKAMTQVAWIERSAEDASEGTKSHYYALVGLGDKLKPLQATSQGIGDLAVKLIDEYKNNDVIDPKHSSHINDHKKNLVDFNKRADELKSAIASKDESALETLTKAYEKKAEELSQSQ
jgi:hypothetical protein